MSISNDQIYDALLGIKSDIGSLQTASEAQLEAIKSHGSRLRFLEEAQAEQRGAMRTWGIIAAIGGAISGALGGYFGLRR